MTSHEYLEAYRRFSSLAEQHFSNGDHRAGAEMLYGAVIQIIIAIAINRREPFREHQHRRQTIRALAQELDSPAIAEDFGKAQRLHVHFYLNDLNSADLSDSVNVTHTLINRLLPLSA